jgi:hypothetical protein
MIRIIRIFYINIYFWITIKYRLKMWKYSYAKLYNISIYQFQNSFISLYV